MDPTVVVMEHAPPMAECHWVSLGNSRTTTPVQMGREKYIYLITIYKEQILILKKISAQTHSEYAMTRYNIIIYLPYNYYTLQLYNRTWVVIITNNNVSTHTSHIYIYIYIYK